LICSLLLYDFDCFDFWCFSATLYNNKKQLLAHGRWFSPCTPASSTTKTGRHDIAEMLLKVALNTKNQIIKSFYENKVIQ
jgi:hypothetical protein